MKQDKELIKALKDAVEFEIKGENIYEDLANEAEDEFVKNTFNGLADDETEHIRIINKYIESIESESKFDFDKEMEKVKDINPKRFFGMLTEDFRKKARLDSEQLKPFDTGIELEKNSINYYKEQSEKAKSKITKKFFEFLIKKV